MTVLAGSSMGGAVSLAAAAVIRPADLHLYDGYEFGEA